MTRGLAAQRGVNGVNQLAGCVALAEGKDAVLCCLPHLSSRQTWHRVCLDVLRTLALVDVLSTCEAALQRRATACNHGTFKAQDETKAKQSKAKQSKAKRFFLKLPDAFCLRLLFEKTHSEVLPPLQFVSGKEPLILGRGPHDLILII